MKRIVASFSGGRTSAFMVLELIKKFGKENVDVLFFNTGAEHPKTYKFIRDFVNYFDIDLTCIEVAVNHGGMGRKFLNGWNIVDVNDMKWDMRLMRDVMAKYGRPSHNAAVCTRELKQYTSERYVKHTYGVGNYEVWLGMRADEPRRVHVGRKGYRYLAEISDVDKEDVLDFWKQQPFDLEIKEHLGNCVFCIKKSVGKVALAIKDEPELAKDWKEVIDNANNREDLPEKYAKLNGAGIIYRGNNTFDSVISMYENIDRDDLEKSLTSMKRYDTGSCTESCEAFV